jgi:hypothetical protein
MAIRNVEEFLTRAATPPAYSRSGEVAAIHVETPETSWGLPSDVSGNMESMGLLPMHSQGDKRAAVASAVAKGVSAVAAPGKKLIGGAMDAQGALSTGATVSSNALDLSNLQRPSDFMKSLGKMQTGGSLPAQPGVKLSVAAELSKAAASRMAREGYGAMDRALRHINKADPTISNAIVGRAVKAWGLDSYPVEEAAQLRKALPDMIREGDNTQLNEISQRASSAMSRTPTVQRGQRFADAVGLHPNTAAKMDEIVPTLPEGVHSSQLQRAAYKGELGKMQRGVQKRIDGKVQGRLQSLLADITGKRSPFRDPMLRGAENWDGALGDAYKRQLTQVQAKNRRTTQGVGQRALRAADAAANRELPGKDYSGVLDRYATHFRARASK